GRGRDIKDEAPHDPGDVNDWDPASPAEVAAAFDGQGCRWWVAGGFAIEWAVGRRFRDHADERTGRGCPYGRAVRAPRAGQARGKRA
ncbi:nucleotidyltransferase domain-containing protein, partial [Streptomyces benahoarensis]|uniref:nucleotidyltransferase domain-containing protein n=1 Tax=Streptomyces benahoarensis TaxID=2595054 RepID=UPI003D805EAD